MSKPNSSQQTKQKKSLIPHLKTELFLNLNTFADYLYSQSPRIAYSIPRPLKAKSPKKSFASSQRKDILVWNTDILRSVFVSVSLIYWHLCRFGNLSPSQKIKATTIKNPSFLQNMTNCLPYRGSTTEFNLQSGKSMETLLPKSDEYFESLLVNLNVCWCSQPILSLKEQVFKDERFVEWLDKISNFKLFEYKCEGEDNLLWYSSKTFHPLSHSLASQFQKQICQYFYNKIQYYHQICQLRQFCQKNNKANVLEALENPLLRFVEMSKKELNKVLQKIKIEEEKLALIKAEQIFESMEYLQKGKKSRKKGKKKISSKQQKHEQIDYGVKEIQVKCQKQVETVKISNPIMQIEANVELILLQTNQPQIQFTSLLQRQQNIDSPNACLQDKLLIQKLQCTCFEETQHSQQFTQQNNIISEEAKESKTKKKRRKKEKKQQQIQNFKKDICHKFMTRQLQNIVDFINSQTNKMLQARVMAFQRVRIFIQNSYPFSNSILFGSNAIGLSLPLSDVDILLIGFQCNSRADSGDLLNHIGYLLNCMGWVINCQVYTNAKVPVIKLQIDTSVPYTQLKGSNHYNNHNSGYFFLQTEMEKIVKVDITVNVEGVSSAGYDSTLLMKKWLQKYPLAQKIIILFKHILSYKHLNQNYRGGIGSYCLFVMVMAFIHQYSKDDEIDLSKLFVKILLWYSEEFNSEKQIVWLCQDGPCFVNQQDYQKMYGQSEERRGLLRLIDPTTKRVMSGSCSQYVKIKVFFKQILQQFTEIQQMVLSQLNNQSQSHLQLVKVFQNKKQSQKWFRNTNQRHGWALKNLLGMKD